MKVKLNLPRDWEVKELKYDEETGEITIIPRFIKGRTITDLVYLTTEGDGGMAERALLRCSGRTGQFQVQRISTDEETEALFDKPPEEFKAALDETPEEDPGVEAPPPATGSVIDP